MESALKRWSDDPPTHQNKNCHLSSFDSPHNGACQVAHATWSRTLCLWPWGLKGGALFATSDDVGSGPNLIKLNPWSGGSQELVAQSVVILDGSTRVKFAWGKSSLDDCFLRYDIGGCPVWSCQWCGARVCVPDGYAHDKFPCLNQFVEFGRNMGIWTKISLS